MWVLTPEQTLLLTCLITSWKSCALFSDDVNNQLPICFVKSKYIFWAHKVCGGGGGGCISIPNEDTKCKNIHISWLCVSLLCRETVAWFELWWVMRGNTNNQEYNFQMNIELLCPTWTCGCWYSGTVSVVLMVLKTTLMSTPIMSCRTWQAIVQIMHQPPNQGPRARLRSPWLGDEPVRRR